MNDRKHAVPSETLNEVVWPLGKFVAPPLEFAPGLLDLNGKTIGELWDGVFKGDQIYPIIREELRNRYPGIKIVDYETMGYKHGNNISERAYIAALPALLRHHQCDAVIVAVGA